MTLTKRYVSSGAEKWLCGAFYLDGSGKIGDFDYRTESETIELVDYMGGDATVLRVATAGHGIEIFPEKPTEENFLEHLVAKGITAPFRSVQFQFCMQAPIQTALTFVYDPRVSVNEYSGRYSVMIDSSHLPSPESIASQLKGSSLETNAQGIHNILKQQRGITYHRYKQLMDLDLARELARIGLGIDNDTKYYWKIDLPNLASFVQTQRKLLSPESITRTYVETIAKIAEESAPIAWKALFSASPKEITLTMPSDEVIVDPPLNAAAWEAKETKRVTVAALEDVLFVEKKYLEDGAFQVVDYLGDDSTPARAARASYGRGTAKLQEDKGLIRTLVRDLHTSPIEMTSLAFESKTPLFVDPRQAGRHRTLPHHQFMGYAPLGSKFFLPGEDQLCYQDRTNRQGRGKEMDDEDKCKALTLLRDTFAIEQDIVRQLREYDAPEELIRSIKGVGFYTRGWRCGDGHNLSHFLRLRLDIHAQKEIRDFAALIDDAHRKHTPNVNEALYDYHINGMRLSRMEVEELMNYINLEAVPIESLETYRRAGFVKKKKGEDVEFLNLDGQGLQKKLWRFRGLKNGT
ncbi:MAG: FAD-dependent thymidylate synthase [bacterium]|nr:FAD-dependent thymidylate synthase [bacterium]